MAKKESQKDKLLKELQTLLPQVDEQGLSFLIQQTTTLIYNEKVKELNASREIAEQTQSPAAEKQPKKSNAPQVYFETGKSGSSFFLDVDGKRAILDQDELMQMVKIAQVADDSKTARERVYRWLKKNRDDIIFDCGLQPGGAKIAALCERLQSDFAIRE
ncbi:MAG: hypothetical protein R6V86_12995, partial [Spirochaetia bacterium]